MYIYIFIRCQENQTHFSGVYYNVSPEAGIIRLLIILTLKKHNKKAICYFTFKTLYTHAKEKYTNVLVTLKTHQNVAKINILTNIKTNLIKTNISKNKHGGTDLVCVVWRGLTNRYQRQKLIATGAEIEAPSEPCFYIKCICDEAN